jgi:hypothetical protein
MDWLKNLFSDTFTFGDLLTILSMVVAIFAAFVSWVKSIRAKESELKAEEYSKNANDFNLAAKKYYDEMIVVHENAKPKMQREELKEKAHIFISVNMMPKTMDIAEYLAITKEEAFDLLKEMLYADKSISCAGQCTQENIDGVLWQNRRG